MASNRTEPVLTGPNAADRIGEYALVIYIPGPLGSFLNRIRKELDPEGLPGRAHVTVLPPRPLGVDVETASEQLRNRMRALSAFPVEVTGVEVFHYSRVVYLAIGAGGEELARIHGLLNVDGTAFAESYPFHPHVTLAQCSDQEHLRRVTEKARGLWSRYRGPRSFSAENAALVRNTVQNEWIDLAEFRLKPREDRG